MNRVDAMLSGVDNIIGFVHGIGRAVNDQQELICLQRELVLKNAVLRYPDAGQASADCADAAHNHRSLQACYDPSHQGSSDQNGADTRYCEHTCPKQQPPESSPERARFPQCFIRSPVL